MKPQHISGLIFWRPTSKWIIIICIAFVEYHFCLLKISISHVTFDSFYVSWISVITSKIWGIVIPICRHFTSEDTRGVKIYYIASKLDHSSHKYKLCYFGNPLGLNICNWYMSKPVSLITTFSNSYGQVIRKKYWSRRRYTDINKRTIIANEIYLK